VKMLFFGAGMLVSSLGIFITEGILTTICILVFIWSTFLFYKAKAQ
jgi:hypothetical protein